MEASGGTTKSLEERTVEALERSAFAQEELIRLATEERDAGESMLGPPLCPHCGRLDPSIRSEGGSGQFAEFVLIAQCENCNKPFLAISQGWLTYRNRQEYEGRNQ
jgi:hypothetical protein